MATKALGVEDVDSTKPGASSLGGGGTAVKTRTTSTNPQQLGHVDTTSPRKGSDLLPKVIEQVTKPTKMYWVGALPSCPYGFVTLKGVCFPKYISPERMIAGSPMRTADVGAVVELNADQLAEIKASVALKFFRKRGEAWDIYSVGSKAARELSAKNGRPNAYEQTQAGDLGVAEFLFCVESGSDAATAARSGGGAGHPPPLSVTGL